RGKIELEVARRDARPPLTVRAGDTDVIVVGTHFTVDYGDGRGEVDVRVRDGVVRVIHQQQETRVAAGQAWRTRGGLVAAMERDASSPPSGPAGGAPASGEPGGMPAGDLAIALGELPEVLHDRKAAAPDAPPVSSAVSSASSS